MIEADFFSFDKNDSREENCKTVSLENEHIRYCVYFIRL